MNVCLQWCYKLNSHVHSYIRNFSKTLFTTFMDLIRNYLFLPLIILYYFLKNIKTHIKNLINWKWYNLNWKSNVIIDKFKVRKFIDYLSDPSKYDPRPIFIQILHKGFSSVYYVDIVLPSWLQRKVLYKIFKWISFFLVIGLIFFLIEFIGNFFYQKIFIKRLKNKLKRKNYLYLNYLFLSIRFYYLGIKSYIKFIFFEMFYISCILLPFILFRVIKKIIIILYIHRSDILFYTFNFLNFLIKTIVYWIPKNIYILLKLKETRYILTQFYKESLIYNLLYINLYKIYLFFKQLIYKIVELVGISWYYFISLFKKLYNLKYFFIINFLEKKLIIFSFLRNKFKMSILFIKKSLNNCKKIVFRIRNKYYKYKYKKTNIRFRKFIANQLKNKNNVIKKKMQNDSILNFLYFDRNFKYFFKYKYFYKLPVDRYSLYKNNKIKFYENAHFQYKYEDNKFINLFFMITKVKFFNLKFGNFIIYLRALVLKYNNKIIRFKNLDKFSFKIIWDYYFSNYKGSFKSLYSFYETYWFALILKRNCIMIKIIIINYEVFIKLRIV